MKFFLAIALVPVVTAFVPTTIKTPVAFSRTALEASKSSRKQAKRAAWVESRGGAAPAVAESLATLTNDSGLSYVELTSPNGSTSQIYTLGACVTSYKTGDVEYLKVRPDAKMDGSKPISGGLAFCWPQFGPDSGHEGLNMQQHGFARNEDWAVESVTGDEVVMSLSPSDYSKGMWDKEFKAEYTVKITDDSLDTKFTVKNEGSEDFTHQAALHSYFDISSVSNLSIEGSFKGKEYLDKMSGETKTEERDSITITEETDSVYKGVNDPSVVDSGKGKKISVVDAKGWTDCVVWNPFGNEGMGYDGFVCAESVAFDPVTVPAGGEWEGSMSLKASDL